MQYSSVFGILKPTNPLNYDDYYDPEDFQQEEEEPDTDFLLQFHKVSRTRSRWNCMLFSTCHMKLLLQKMAYIYSDPILMSPPSLSTLKSNVSIKAPYRHKIDKKRKRIEGNVEIVRPFLIIKISLFEDIELFHPFTEQSSFINTDIGDYMLCAKGGWILSIIENTFKLFEISTRETIVIEIPEMANFLLITQAVFVGSPMEDNFVLAFSSLYDDDTIGMNIWIKFANQEWILWIPTSILLIDVCSLIIHNDYIWWFDRENSCLNRLSRDANLQRVFLGPYYDVCACLVACDETLYIVFPGMVWSDLPIVYRVSYDGLPLIQYREVHDIGGYNLFIIPGRGGVSSRLPTPPHIGMNNIFIGIDDIVDCSWFKITTRQKSVLKYCHEEDFHENCQGLWML